MFKNKLKLDNRGSGIITVMVAVMFLSVLGSLLLMTSLSGFEMKVAERKGKQNFYDAETAMSEIKAGFQDITSGSMDDALKNALGNLGSTSENNTQSEFEREFCERLKGIYVTDADGDYFKESGSNERNSDTKLLSSNFTSPTLTAEANRTQEICEYNPVALAYMVKNCSGHGTITINTKATLVKPDGTVDTIDNGTAKVYIAYKSSADEPKVICNIKTTTVDGSSVTEIESITFKGISVTFEYENRVTTVSTDISISIPDVAFGITGAGAASITKYAFIAGGTLTQSDNSSNVSIKGSAYMGNIVASGDSTLTFGDGSDSTDSSDHESTTVVVKEKVQADGKTEDDARILFNDYSTLWAKDVVVGNRSKVSLYGTTYLTNDLELKGYKSVADIGGAYHGIGTSTTDTDESSSIIANGIGTKLNFVNRITTPSLEIAGFSFIGSSSDQTDNKPRMGESISAKGNQSVYLAEPQLLLYSGSLKKTLKTNPMVYGVNETPATVHLDTDYSIQGTNPVTGEFKNCKFEDYGAYVQQVVKPISSTQKFVYYFIAFNDTKVDEDGNLDDNGTITITARENAGRFFKDYYSNNTDELTALIAKYMKTSGSIGSSAYAGAGAWVQVYDVTINGEAKALSEFHNYMSNNSYEKVKNDAVSKKDKFENYLTKFLTNVLPDADTLPTEKVTVTENGADIEKPIYETDSYNPYKYYIDEAAITTGKNITVGDKTVNSKINENQKSYFPSESAPQAVIINGDYTFDESEKDTIHLIICQGNVKIKKDFTGTIFCSGNLEIKSGEIKIQYDEAALTEAIKSANANGLKPNDYFRVKLVSDIEWNNESGESSASSITSMVKYENWRKE